MQEEGWHWDDGVGGHGFGTGRGNSGWKPQGGVYNG